MALTVEQAREDMARMSRWFNTPSNGATTATHGARNNAEQVYGIAARTLMKAGELFPLKRKYNQFR